MITDPFTEVTAPVGIVSRGGLAAERGAVWATRTVGVLGLRLSLTRTGAQESLQTRAGCGQRAPGGGSTAPHSAGDEGSTGEGSAESGRPGGGADLAPSETII